MAAYIDVSAAIKEAEHLLKQKADLMEKIQIVRTDLRNSVTMSVANAEQVQWIEEQFPVRERETDPAKQLAKAQEKVRELQARQQKGAAKVAA